ncbi:MAG: hypothetical protein Q8K64_07310, partial [Sediminibacterium sp.]|nr:hypothetical protein [Sediminibacterium sp.]
EQTQEKKFKEAAGGSEEKKLNFRLLKDTHVIFYAFWFLFINAQGYVYQARELAYVLERIHASMR